MATTALATPLRPISFACLVLLATCESTPPTNPAPIASLLEVRTGDNQIASPSSSVVLSVRAIDNDGDPVAGAIVVWSAEGGGWVNVTLDETKTSIALTDTTDAAGISTITRTLAVHAGAYLTAAALFGLPQSAIRLTSRSSRFKARQRSH